MSFSVVRTRHGFHVERGGFWVRIADPSLTTGDLLADRSALEKAVDSADHGESLEATDLLSPVTTPCRIVAQMVNYHSHARDSGIDPERVQPTFFRKASGSVVGPTAEVVKPAHVSLLDYEVELGLVVGKRLPIGTRVSDSNLAEYVAGLVVANDVSARDIQLPKTQFYESKSYPTFTPLGPRLVIVDAAEIDRIPDLRLRLEVDDEVRQDAYARDMITFPAEALDALARFQELAPGDVLLTGTPGGTALRSPGVVLEKIGALLPSHMRWKAFFRRQSGNPAYLRAGQTITSSVATDDGLLNLGTQRNVVACAE